VIGAGLTAKATGAGHRLTAALLGRPPETVRGWLRRFATRVEEVRAVFHPVVSRVGARTNGAHSRSPAESSPARAGQYPPVALRLIYLIFSKLLGVDGAVHPIRHHQGNRDPRPAPPTGRAATTHATVADELDRPGMITGLSRLLPVRRRLGMLVTPSTILRWLRLLVARRWTTQPVRPSRPAIPAGVRALLIRWPLRTPKPLDSAGRDTNSQLEEALQPSELFTELVEANACTG
jgi:hypothetical protein